LQSSPGPSNLHDEQLHRDPVALEQIYLPGILHVGPRTQDVATQTQWPETPEVSRKPKVATYTDRAGLWGKIVGIASGLSFCFQGHDPSSSF